MKTILGLLLDEAFVRQALLILPLVTLVTGVTLGIIAGRLHGHARLNLVRGLFYGLSGALVLLMWFAYNQVIEWYGLDTVKMLTVNLALFVTVGVGIGVAIRYGDPYLEKTLDERSPKE